MYSFFFCYSECFTINYFALNDLRLRKIYNYVLLYNIICVLFPSKYVWTRLKNIYYLLKYVIIIKLFLIITFVLRI